MQLTGASRRQQRPANLAEHIYARLKDDIGQFRLLPGDRFSEGEIATRMAVSRTPVRQALDRLAREGYLEVYFRSGWQVRPFDFERFEELYEVRVTLEMEAVRRLCERPANVLHAALESLMRTWIVHEEERLSDEAALSQLDEQFHCHLLELAGNREMARIHRETSEKIRIIRRLDFTQGERVAATYEEHAEILRAILARRRDEAQQLLRNHIEASKAAVRTITLHMLHNARRPATPRQEVPSSTMEQPPCKDAV
ncbi:GntR family transcriptional regulator [Stutzerimonas kirkiae]|uniref:GntR family transcriptional regulator n=1 Tax=Stutzerimonas kirkiae TaxID=2211392 RepID=A0A4Q9QYQ3_9GAMM|nr:GntR family transcriptional regulator [Stutzerimonas kirkiae]TBU90653.1 GntR family transcriptional regulator [Stutzerimonas kirkiae]TBV00165.1 GntR family transcriptional regulator [Stutzerimonas kirkiae]TBV04778.1 GntR family transcriptional regulator [Stutzerimonas kirkiae]TBV14056.1 GntR family transcriptional regulator [Stutzerimonas kirkiae]